MRPLTSEDKVILFKIREILDNYYPFVIGNPAAINNAVEGMRLWQPGSYKVNDVVQYKGNPYKCIQLHDSTDNPTWTPAENAALWMEYHGTSKETARNWVAPKGSENMYRVGEWMIFTDGKYYECLTDTVYSPIELASAWQVEGKTPTPEPEPSTIPDFVQPTGGQDAYNKGDKVKFEGKIYESLIDANVYSPSAYPLGWQEVEE